MRLTLQHNRNRTTAGDWNLSFEKRGATLFLEGTKLSFGRQWRRHIKEELWPEFDIELAGPPRPTVVSWREGRLVINNWNADFEASFLKGRADVIGGRGQLKLQQSEADLSVKGWHGPAFINGESGKVTVSEVKGDVTLSWLNGLIRLNRCQGITKIDSSDSSLQVVGGSGEVHVNMPKGKALIDGFQGLVKASGVESEWTMAAGAPTDLNITTSAGSVRLKWKGGANVFLTSTGGSINGPELLKKSVREGRKVVQGALPGRAPGQVFVRTATGGIFWAQ